MKKSCCVLGLTLLLTGCNIASTVHTMRLVSGTTLIAPRLKAVEDVEVASTGMSSTTFQPLEEKCSEKFWTLKDVDVFDVIPITELSVEEQVAIRTFINDTMNDNLYTRCVAIEYVVDEELNGHCYHFVFDDSRYMCIYYEEGHKKPLLLYDKILDGRLVEKWQYV